MAELHTTDDGGLDISYYMRPSMGQDLHNETIKRLQEIDDPLLMFWLGMGYAASCVGVYMDGNPMALEGVTALLDILGRKLQKEHGIGLGYGLGYKGTVPSVD
jgi:hypothetical protein